MDSIIPDNLKASADFGYSKHVKREETEKLNFELNTNKIQTIGRLKPKVMAIICDGNGKLRFINIEEQSKAHAINEKINSLRILKDAKNEGLLSIEEYEECRKRIVNSL